MQAGDFVPGELIVVRWGAEIKRHMTEIQFYTEEPNTALVVQQSHEWIEHDHLGALPGLSPTYLVLFSSDNRMYLVSGDCMQRLDDAESPRTTLQRLRG